MKKLKKVKKSYGAGGKNTKPKMLKGGQVKLDKNKDGKISGADFKMMKNGGKMMSKGMAMMEKAMMKYGGKK